ncbi:MAG: helix-turn-helix transcriptional regulator [Bacteroidia bacterium]
MAIKKRTNLKKGESTPELQKLGDRLLKLRKQAGYTSAEKFALDNEFSRVHYARVEMGLHDIKYSMLCALAKAHKISPSELLDGLK